MDLQKDYSCLERSTLVLERSVEAENDFQEALPAYCDDVYKVIKCVAKNSVTSAELRYNEVQINVKCQICLTYLNEDSNLCYADFEENFTKNISVDNLSDQAFVYVRVHNKYLSYRVINQRRIDIHSAVIIDIKLFDKVKCPCLVSCENAKLKQETITAVDSINAAVTRVEFDEDFMIPSDSPPIKRIISCCANASVSDIKIIKDKVLIKGDVNMSVLYSTDAEREEIMKTEYAFHFSKILDVSGVEEGDTALSDITVSNVYLKAKLSSGDKMNVISAFGELTVNLLFLREIKEDIICDGYVLHCRSQCSYSDYSYWRGGKLLTDSFSENVSFDLPKELSEIKELCVALSAPQLRGNKLVYHATAHFIGLTENGEITASDGTAELSYPLEDYDNAFACFSLVGYDYHCTQDNKAEVRLNIHAAVYVYHTGCCKVLADITPSEEYIEYPSLTVYFAKKDETLWDIAKQFSSDAGGIAADNHLTDSSLNSDSIIIIPKV